MIYYDELCKAHVDGDDKEEWEDFNTLVPTHHNYEENSKALFYSFWIEFKDDFDAGKYPADISPKKLNEALKAAASGRAASGPRPSPTAPPAMNMANTFSFGADSVGAAMGNMNITPPAAQTFTFGGPSRSIAEREAVEIDVDDEEVEEEEEEEEEEKEEEVLQKVVKKSMTESSEDEDDDDDDAQLPGAALNKKKK